MLSREAKASHSKRPMDRESNQHHETGTSRWLGADEASGSWVWTGRLRVLIPVGLPGMVPRGCQAPVGSTLGRVWKPGSCRLRGRWGPCAHLSGRNWVCHCLGRKENKQLSQTSGIRFPLNFLLRIHTPGPLASGNLPTCLEIPPLCSFLKTKTGNIRKSFH